MPEHTVAAGVIIAGGRVLLAHRHPQRRWYPDRWDLIGGHLEAGEDPLDALRRECHEELGIAVDDAEPLRLPSSDAAVEMHTFLVTRWSGEPRNLAPDEHDDLRWFDASQITELPLADPAYAPVLARLLAADSAGPE